MKEEGIDYEEIDFSGVLCFGVWGYATNPPLRGVILRNPETGQQVWIHKPPYIATGLLSLMVAEATAREVYEN